MAGEQSDREGGERAVAAEGAPRPATTPASRRGRASGPPRRRGWLVAYGLLALAALVAAGMSWRTYWQVRTRPPDFRPACTLSETVDCAKAARSEYAQVLGVPTALWAAVAFIVMIGLVGFGLRTHQGTTFPAGLLFWLAVAAAAASAAMAAVSRFALDVVCIECTVIQVLSVAILATAAGHLREVRCGAFRALASDLRHLGSHAGATVTVGTLGLAVVGGLVLFYPVHGRPQPPVPPLLPTRGLPTGLTDHGNPYIGSDHPAVSVMEFTDYECPHCHEAHRRMRHLAALHPDRIRLIHYHLPLDRACNPDVTKPFHRQACRLAEIAACASIQGRFWEMNDMIIGRVARSASLRDEDLARAAGLDLDAFRKCMREGEGRARVARDIEAAAELKRDGRGIGTPGFVIEDASGRRDAYIGLGGADGVPPAVLQRLEAGWPEHADRSAVRERRVPR